PVLLALLRRGDQRSLRRDGGSQAGAVVARIEPGTEAERAEGQRHANGHGGNASFGCAEQRGDFLRDGICGHEPSQNRMRLAITLTAAPISAARTLTTPRMRASFFS